MVTLPPLIVQRMLLPYLQSLRREVLVLPEEHNVLRGCLGMTMNDTDVCRYSC